MAGASACAQVPSRPLGRWPSARGPVAARWRAQPARRPRLPQHQCCKCIPIPDHAGSVCDLGDSLDVSTRANSTNGLAVVAPENSVPSNPWSIVTWLGMSATTGALRPPLILCPSLEGGRPRPCNRPTSLRSFLGPSARRHRTTATVLSAHLPAAFSRLVSRCVALCG